MIVKLPLAVFAAVLVLTVTGAMFLPLSCPPKVTVRIAEPDVPVRATTTEPKPLRAVFNADSIADDVELKGSAEVVSRLPSIATVIVNVPSTVPVFRAMVCTSFTEVALPAILAVLTLAPLVNREPLAEIVVASIVPDEIRNRGAVSEFAEVVSYWTLTVPLPMLLSAC